MNKLSEVINRFSTDNKDTLRDIIREVGRKVEVLYSSNEPCSYGLVIESVVQSYGARRCGPGAPIVLVTEEGKALDEPNDPITVMWELKKELSSRCERQSAEKLYDSNSKEWRKCEEQNWQAMLKELGL